MSRAAETAVEIGTAEGRLCVRIRGPAVHSAALLLDRLLNDYLAAHAAGPSVAIDLTHSPWIDSTVAGWLLKLRGRIAGCNGTLGLAGCSEPCRESLHRMRIATLFEAVTIPEPREWRALPTGVAASGVQGEIGGAQHEAMRLMTEAHAALAAVDEENRRVFGPIAEMLGRQIGPPSPPV